MQSKNFGCTCCPTTKVASFSLVMVFIDPGCDPLILDAEHGSSLGYEPSALRSLLLVLGREARSEK